MKLFQNPWVAGGLAVVAVGVVFYLVFLPRLKTSRGTPVQPGAALAAAGASAGSASVLAPPPKTVPPPVAEIDLNYAQTHFQEWIDTPARDPFLLNFAIAPPPKAPQEVSPVALMKLKAIWRQTGGGLAAIDHGLYREGEEIVPGYKLDRIERDQVWIQGPEKQERLDFDKRFVLVETPRGTNFIERFLGPEQSDPLRPKL